LKIKKESKKMEEKDREIWVGENRIYLGEDNIIHFINVGEHDEKIAIACKEAILKFFNTVDGEVHGLIDLSKAGKQSPEARKIWREISEFENTAKVAIHGLNPVARVIASFVMGVSKNKNMRFFKTKEAAIAWLKE